MKVEISGTELEYIRSLSSSSGLNCTEIVRLLIRQHRLDGGGLVILPSQGTTLAVQSQCTPSTLPVQSQYTPNALPVQSQDTPVALTGTSEDATQVTGVEAFAHLMAVL